MLHNGAETHFRLEPWKIRHRLDQRGTGPGRTRVASYRRRSRRYNYFLPRVLAEVSPARPRENVNMTDIHHTSPTERIDDDHLTISPSAGSRTVSSDHGGGTVILPNPATDDTAHAPLGVLQVKSCPQETTQHAAVVSERAFANGGDGE